MATRQVRLVGYGGLLVALVGCAPARSAERAGGPAPRAVRVDTVRVVDSALPAPAVPDTALRAGRFDNGKMWTFEFPPLDYFRETYGFAPDSAWFRRARLGALRLPNCSASFVSAQGLVLTNHHCARESATQVAGAGERVLDEGFYAATRDAERRVDDLHADQLVAIVDVTGEVDAAAAGAREAVEERIRERLTEEYAPQGDSIVVELIALWNGARTSAYVFRRFTDVRLVMVPELKLGYFGGDPDNFTYPRYALDMSFFRVYQDGEPYRPDVFFRWTETGVEAGDAVFVIGNPGSTSRLQTVTQLEFRRDVGEPATLGFITSRVAALRTFADSSPGAADTLDLRNTIFSLENAAKAYTGMWKGLRDPVILARRRDAERRFREAIGSDSALAATYAGVFEAMAQVQAGKRRVAAELGAFIGFGSPTYTAAAVRRALAAYQYLAAQGGGAPDAMLSGMRDRLLSVGEQPDALQRQLLAARLRDLREHLGDTSQVVRELLPGRDAFAAAAAIIERSVLADSGRAAEALRGGTLTERDPAVQLVRALIPALSRYQNVLGALSEREDSLAAVLGRAHYAVYGTEMPPDATFSLRIADGVVRGYAYNGTLAPVHTTFYGLYDHYHSYGADSDWDLPARWLPPPPVLDLATPLNFVSTADIIGGNSGSPVLSRALELVGVVFDGNIESLPGDYIYLPERNRAVAVDARGMLEALATIYRADRLVTELRGRPGAPSRR